MRKTAIAAAMLVLLAAPAHAQMGRGHHGGGDKDSASQKPAVDEKAYKAALERIPEPKTKYDPWGLARPTVPQAKSK